MVMSSPVGEVWKTLSVAIVFQYFRQFREKQWPGTFEIFAPRLYNLCLPFLLFIVIWIIMHFHFHTMHESVFQTMKV